jgi:hypothetical protein
MLSAIMLNVVRLIVVRLNVIMLSVVVPFLRVFLKRKNGIELVFKFSLLTEGTTEKVLQL